MVDKLEVLEKIGLTSSESKVYSALLGLGSVSRKELIKKSGISPSKIYEVTDKLIEKGLVSYILKNKVKYFKAAPPSRVIDYLRDKKNEIDSKEKEFSKILPFLENQTNLNAPDTEVEIYSGWRGLQTAYNDILNSMQKGDTNYIFGASEGIDPKKTRSFFDKYLQQSHDKGIKLKIIFNLRSKDYHESSDSVKKHVEVKYMEQITPAEINIYNNKVLIVILTKTPLVIMITGEEVSHSFKAYFDVMWAIAKK